MKNETEIDIVITWVDGNDPTWRKRFEGYASSEKSGDKREIRFRDWGLLRYWFRGIETFAPWVRKVHFVTSGEFPEWLNSKAPKLNWVQHRDFIPEEFLPTFSINAIETNLHRIEGLAEQFIFFNDDMLLTASTSACDYFKQGLPVDFAILDPIFPEKYPGIFINSIAAINRHFSKREVVKNNPLKWINPVYGKYLSKSILLLPWKKFPGMLVSHQPQAFRKSTFEEVWAAEREILTATGRARFRTNDDVNQWLFRFWHLAKGEFNPGNILAKSAYFEISEQTTEAIIQSIESQRYKQVCLNDDEGDFDFAETSIRIQKAFEKILPQRSSFEK